MIKRLRWLPLAAYLGLVIWAGLPQPQDGPSLPPAPWEEIT